MVLSFILLLDHQPWKNLWDQREGCWWLSQASASHWLWDLRSFPFFFFFTSLLTSFFTTGRKGSVVWNSWCGSYCKPGGDVNYFPRQHKSATGGQLSIPSLQSQRGPLFGPLYYFQGLLILFSLQMRLPHKCLCTLQRSSVRLYAIYWQILFCTRQTE